MSDPASAPATTVERPPSLIWDFDGTVADSHAAVFRAATVALDAHGLALDEEALRRTSGLALDRAMVVLTGGDPADERRDEELINSLVAHYREAFRGTENLVRPFPGVVALLDQLAGRGHRCAVATGRRRVSTEALVEQLGLSHRFEALHCASDVDPAEGKPHPELARRACGSLGCVPADAIVIGDSVFDIQMGHAAGTRTVAVTWGSGNRAALAAAGPTHLVDDVAELRELLTTRL